MSLASRLTQARKDKNLTQEAVSEATGLTRQGIGQYESGQHEPGATALGKLAKCYGVSADWLLGLKSPGKKR